MAKRHLDQGGADDSDIHRRETKRRLASAAILRNMMSGISLDEFVPRLEPFFRRVVQEEVNCAIQRLLPSPPRSSVNPIESSGASALQLFFHSQLPCTLFTSSKVQSEDGEPIKIVLVDPNSNKRITSGPMSSIKIQIVVLNGDFVAGDKENWTKKDFDASVIREREGKRPLVTGDLTLTLRNGVAELGHICFTDNSSWIRSRKFRLGARMQGMPDVRVKEAKSEPFIVKDHRGESYKKHHQPSLTDEVWRLERIAKDGVFHKRLASARIYTVEDFLRLYVTDPSSLRNVLGGGISNRTWETITGHAINCTLDDKIYLYRGVRVVLVFNSIWKAIGAIFDGQNFQNLDKLTPFQMRFVEDVKRQAYKNLHELVLYTEESFIGSPMLLSSLQAEMANSHTAGQQNVNTLTASEGQLPTLPGFDYTTSLYPAFELDSSPPDISLAHDCHSMQAISATTRDSIVTEDYSYGTYREEYNAAPNGSLGSVFTSGSLVNDDIDFSQMQRGKGTNIFLLRAINQSTLFPPIMVFMFRKMEDRVQGGLSFELP
ncbi:Calmodulin-binding protein 60 B [Heracleum sosnowskyi]|uniref:Calmodulin-binding protein 60 B n=1 Tax=Heracleum sosnowskyi TaxID=360622 RepID=A0AAD8HV45_9APIA|nr:Calmodulin-binding protein 60 B [Heracleum sosnowskyi]